MRVKALARFIIERHAIYDRRACGMDPPWTKDKILQTYRFCNVYRELDRVTQWIRRYWREPHQMESNLWFAMVVARLINHPPTLALMKCPSKKWDPVNFVQAVRERQRKGLKAFGSAYIVSTNGIKKDKIIYLCNHVLSPMWGQRDELRPRDTDTLTEFYSGLVQCNGMGSFLAAQVVADIKYVYPLKDAADWWTFAASGPGSRRGLNRVLGNPVKQRWNETDWRFQLRRLRAKLKPYIEEARMPKLHAQDLQNCLCEFDKYERARLGQGRPKQLFTPQED